MVLQQLVKELWNTGFHWALIATAIVGSVVLLLQIGWTFYRWVVDANTEWDEKTKDKKIFCGGFNWPIKINCHETKPFIAAIILCCMVFAILSSVWPIVIMAAVLCIFGHGTRGCLRFKRKVGRALDDKADKDHGHDDKYEHKASDGAVNV